MIRRDRPIGLALAAIAFLAIACGKKGPPLPPLVKLPVPPADLAALRRGDTVDLSFSVPSTNTDGTRPANVASAEVYAITAPVTVPPLSDANLLKYGTRVGSVQVKAPKDPNLTANEEDPGDEVDAPEGPGLEQGAAARVTEPLTRAMLTSVDVPRDKNAPPQPAPIAGGPLLGPPPSVAVRTYVAFGTSARGKKGPLSKRVTVPLIPPPPPPAGATMTYDETTVTLVWPTIRAAVIAPADGGLLPARLLGAAPSPAVTYNVYDASAPDAVVKLTAAPITESTYDDKRVVFGERRCYVVVAAENIGGTTIESEPPPPACETLVDRFPPAAPKGINAIASEGTINLIWEPNSERDLAGYIVLRGVQPAETLEPITPEPIAEPSFHDAVKPGVAYVYAIRAVDKTGNASPLSPRVVETAR